MGKPGKAVLATLVAVAVTLALPVTAGATTPFGKNGRIAVIMGAGDVGMLNADGSLRDNLTESPANRSLTTFSPLGTSILFWDGASDDIWTIRTKNGFAENLTETGNSINEFATAFFPDGSRIVYSRRDGSEIDIWTMKPDGSDQRPLLETAADDEYVADVSPDGRRILFTRQINGSNDDSDVWVMRANGTGEDNLTETASPIGEFWASFSPSGRSITYDRVEGGDRDVYVMKANGSGQRPLADSADSERQPVFAPDGSRILYTRCSAGCDLYTVRLSGAPEDNLTETPLVGENTPDWESIHRCAGRRATILGDDGPDVIRGTKKADVIVGFAGNDTLIGRRGNDRLCGGKGRDRLRAGKGRDRCKGGPARDLGRGCERAAL